MCLCFHLSLKRRKLELDITKIGNWLLLNILWFLFFIVFFSVFLHYSNSTVFPEGYDVEQSSCQDFISKRSRVEMCFITLYYPWMHCKCQLFRKKKRAHVPRNAGSHVPPSMQPTVGGRAGQYDPPASGSTELGPRSTSQTPRPFRSARPPPPWPRAAAVPRATAVPVAGPPARQCCLSCWSSQAWAGWPPRARVSKEPCRRGRRLSPFAGQRSAGQAGEGASEPLTSVWPQAAAGSGDAGWGPGPVAHTSTTQGWGHQALKCPWAELG